MNKKIHYDFIINNKITGFSLKKSSLLASSESKISLQVDFGLVFYFNTIPSLTFTSFTQFKHQQTHIY